MRLTLATAVVLLTASAAIAQTTTGTTQGPAGTSAPGSVAAPGTTMSPTGGIASPVTGVHAPAATVNTTPQTTSSPNASAVQTNNATSRTSAAPVPGRNSFTMGEARRRITSAGFAKVSGLKKDPQGIWRGQAEKNGASVGVALDYQGNVVGQ